MSRDWTEELKLPAALVQKTDRAYGDQECWQPAPQRKYRSPRLGA